MNKHIVKHIVESIKFIQKQIHPTNPTQLFCPEGRFTAGRHRQIKTHQNYFFFLPSFSLVSFNSAIRSTISFLTRSWLIWSYRSPAKLWIHGSGSGV